MRFFILLLLSFSISPALSETANHHLWGDLLHKHVSWTSDNKSTVVNYQGFFDDRLKLSQYLQGLSSVKKINFDNWDQSTQQAFLINTYNAFTVNYILTKWPNISSIKELGTFFSSPWSKDIVPLFGGLYSLDNIEHDFIRGSGDFSDPRIHFAVNCASVGCPALRPEAYIGEKLDAQLEDQVILFLSDRSRNHLEENILKISPIFKWYKKDFEMGWKGLSSLESFLAYYSKPLGLTKNKKRELLNGEVEVKFLDYDWKLNEK